VIPLRQTEPSSTTPIVTRALVIGNTALFIAQIILGARTESLINTFGYIPARFMNPGAYGFTHLEVAVTLVSSIFLHGGLVHLFGNMIYLWIFGPAVEDALGHWRYLLFYVVCGAVGSLTHTMLFPQSIVPSVGASGSIAGLLGAFLVLRPKARIVTLFPLVVYWAMAEIRAVIFLPVWFAMQFFNGALALASAPRTPDVAGVAGWAHVGGFVLGGVGGAGARLWKPRV
jgi:membrane associated rhomboid family serine protease